MTKNELDEKKQLEYCYKEYDGLASYALFKTVGCFRCKTMSYENCYLKCIKWLENYYRKKQEKFIKDLKEVSINLRNKLYCMNENQWREFKEQKDFDKFLIEIDKLAGDFENGK